MRILILLLFLTSFLQASAQTFYAGQANEKVHGATCVRINSVTGIPEYVALQASAQFTPEKLNGWVQANYHLSADITFTIRSRERDTGNREHIRFNQLYKGVVVEGAVLVAHLSGNKIFALNGEVFNITSPGTASVTEVNALQAAVTDIAAQQYRPFTAGTLVYAPVNGNFTDPSFRLAYKFDIYATQPLSRHYVYVDAATAQVIWKTSRIHTGNATGTAHTKYNGVHTITTDSYAGGYRLRETGRGNGIRTMNLQNDIDAWNAVDFTDSDNNWNNINANQDEVATDAHRNTEMTYDFYNNIFGRNSIDDNGFELISYVHTDFMFTNAFWDGTGMFYGDGDGTDYTPFTTTDICGHEVTHGLTELTAGLIYQDESGALNESFSDIFGVSIDFYANPATANWVMGEEMDINGFGVRSMSDQNGYMNPDTYNGDYWLAGNDVHINSGVQNFWYYLLVNGGSGTNDLNNTYSVTGIGIAAARAIAYRTLTVYLTPSSDYADARFYSLQAAEDLYGACSPQYQRTAGAWYAVGVGGSFTGTVAAGFNASQAIMCSLPATVQFQNTSNSANTYQWSFGDGGTSTDVNPVHVYNGAGPYTVRLIVTGCGGVKDTLVRTNYITYDPNSTACTQIVMPPVSGSSSSCTGHLFDSGGPNGDYSDMEQSTFVINPPGAASITLNFVSFTTEDTYDFLYIYDGPSTNSALLGVYDGWATPPNITSTGGAITLVFTSDPSITESGFELYWTCTQPTTPPVATFSYSSGCSNIVTFNDGSGAGVNSWRWNFGNGQTSTIADPAITFASPGQYSVQLIVCNPIGCDTVTQSVTVNSNTGPVPAQCTPQTISSCCDVGLLNFQMGSINHSSGDAETEGYGDFSCTYSTYITQGLDMPFSVTSGYFEEQVAIWIDLNNNGAFGSNELMYASTVPDYLHTGNINVSTGVMNTPLRMRVASFYPTISLSPCDDLEYGQFQDYGIIISSSNPVPPAAMFSYGSADCNVYSFTDISANSPTSWSWNFGDGGTSNVQNPTHSFAQGTYTIALTATNGAGSNTYTTSLTIPDISAAFTIPDTVFINTGVTPDNNSINATAYSWSMGNGLSSLLDEPTFTYTQAGTYTVTLTALAGGCSKSTTATIVAILSTGIAEVQGHMSFVLWPNPATSQVTLAFDHPLTADGRLTMYNSIGEKVSEVLLKAGAQTHTLDVSTLAGGIYILRAVTAEGEEARRFVKAQ